MVQTQLATLLGLGTNSGISVTSIAAFAATANTETAFEQLCKGLYQIGATEDMIRQKEEKILDILTSHGMVASTQISGDDTGDEDTEDKDPVLEAAYEEYCKDLYRIGVTEDLIRQKEGEIREMLRSRGMVTSSNTGDKGQLLQAGFPLVTYV